MRRDLGEGFAHLVGSRMRQMYGEAGAGFRRSVVCSFPVFQNGVASPRVDIRGQESLEALVLAIMVVSIDKGIDFCLRPPGYCFGHRSGPPLRLGHRGKHMANKRPKPDEFVTTLRQVEGLARQAMPCPDAKRTPNA